MKVKFLNLVIKILSLHTQYLLFQNNLKVKIMEEEEKSFFDGGLLQLIGYGILAFFIVIFTAGICYPWAKCLMLSWETKHTVINGRRLCFDGTGLQLFGNWIKWFVLSLLTLGIYGLWVNIFIKQWVVKHTHFATI